MSDESPPGVLGYVVARQGAKVSLTHSDVMDRAAAEKEAALWRRSGGGAFGRYVGARSGR